MYVAQTAIVVVPMLVWGCCAGYIYIEYKMQHESQSELSCTSSMATVVG